MRAILFTDPHFGQDHKTNLIHLSVLKQLDCSLFDIVIVSGDWGSKSLEDVRVAFKSFREAFPNFVILGVLGNHDLWDEKLKAIQAKFEIIKKYAEEFQIHLLENNPYETDEVTFLGFNGWYYHSHPNTKDAMFMSQDVGGMPVDNYLRNLADQALNNIIDYPKDKNKTIVTVTHFPCLKEVMDRPLLNGNPHHGEALVEFSDLIIFGHTHQIFDKVVRGCRVINVGADYNYMSYRIIDLKNLKKT